MGKQIDDCNIALALKLEEQGLTYNEIAERTGYASRGAVWRAIQHERAKQALSQPIIQRNQAPRATTTESDAQLVDVSYEVKVVTKQRIELPASMQQTDIGQILTQVVSEAWQQDQDNRKTRRLPAQASRCDAASERKEDEQS